MVSTIQRNASINGTTFDVDGSGAIPALPQPYVFPNLGQIHGVNYSQWWWHSVGDLLLCAHNIMTSQGFVQGHNGMINFAPESFFPRSESPFVFLVKHNNLLAERETEKTTLVVGQISECNFRPLISDEVFVSHGWGSAVLGMVREHGVVHIKPSDHQIWWPRIGVRWNGEEVSLNNHKLHWY